MDSLAPPGHRSSLKPPSHQSLSAKRSANSLRTPESLDNGGPPRVSLAHELAAAMMPEPNVTSQMLAEEFGLDFDDGEEAEEEDIDAFATTPGEPVDDPYMSQGQPHTPPAQTLDHFGDGRMEFGQEDAIHGRSMMDEMDEFSSTFLSSSEPPNHFGSVQAEQDPLELLAQNLKATDLFISQLKHVDGEQGTMSEPPLERAAAAMIGRLNDLARERETHVRTIQEYDRELKKMFEDVSWHDALGQLDPLDKVDDLVHPSEKVKDNQVEEDQSRTPRAVRTAHYGGESSIPSSRRRSGRRALYQVEEEEQEEQDMLGEETGYDNDNYDFDVPSPGKFRKHMDLPPPPPTAEVPTPSATLPQFSYIRTLTQSLSSSLTSLSEHAQVNGVNTTDAGRKLRALKNKIVELKADWDSADRSRAKIERWEAGLIDDLTVPDPEEDTSPDLTFSSSSRETSPGPDTPEITPSTKLPVRRIDGRKLVQEQLEGFRHALEEAAQKTQAIMASS